MAFEIGVAANHVDLWDKLLAFLTTNPDLVATGQNWSIGWQAPVGAPNETDCVVVGPGTGGTDQIYVGLRRVDNPATDHYTLWMNGMTGLLTGATQITEHVNVSGRVAVYLDSAPMNYWFVANGRRFMAVIKIATIYEALYGGLFLPYADPLQYSYPLFIGGSVKRTRGDDRNFNWGDTDGSHRNYTLSTGDPQHSLAYNRPATAYMLSPGAEWKHVSYSAGAGSAFLRPFHPAGGLGTHTSASDGTGLSSMLSKTRECLGGGFSLEPATLVSDNPVVQTYGTLDGVYHTPSETNYSENLITVGGVDHLVFQNIWRTDNRHLAAMALE